MNETLKTAANLANQISKLQAEHLELEKWHDEKAHVVYEQGLKIEKLKADNKELLEALRVSVNYTLRYYESDLDIAEENDYWFNKELEIACKTLKKHSNELD